MGRAKGYYQQINVFFVFLFMISIDILAFALNLLIIPFCPILLPGVGGEGGRGGGGEAGERARERRRQL